MGKEFPEIDATMRQWVEKQHLFFVATAPLSGEGMVNCSPKGMDTFRVLGPKVIGYLDLTGSGVETIAHVKENGRIVIMMCAFEGAPKIVRFHGRGSAHEIGTEGYREWQSHFPELPGARAIIIVDVDRISDSCGYAVPLYDYVSDRETLRKWSNQKTPEGVRAYVREKNQASLDGLPGAVLPESVDD